MQSVYSLLAEYGRSHTHPTNKLLHWLCVPLIVLSLLGLIWSIPVPDMVESVPLLNWATVLLLFATLYYVLLSPKLAFGMVIYSVLMLLILHVLNATGITLWYWSCLVFIVAWIGQFIGHHIEGQRPSFLKDLQFLLIGPLWLLAAIYRKLNVPY